VSSSNKVVELLEDDNTPFNNALLEFTYYLNCESVGFHEDCGFQLVLPELKESRSGCFSRAHRFSKLIYDKCLELRSSIQTAESQSQDLAQFLLDHFGYTIYRQHDLNHYFMTEPRGLCWLLVNYQLNYLKEKGLPPTPENIIISHPAMPSDINPLSSSSRHGPDELVAFGNKMKVEMECQQPNLMKVYGIATSDPYHYKDLVDRMERLPEIARSTQSSYGMSIWFTPTPLMFMHKFYRCSFFSEYEGKISNFPWHVKHPTLVYLRASSAVDLPLPENLKTLHNHENTLQGTHRVCPMLFSVGQGIDKKAIREASFSLFSSQPMVMFKGRHFYFLPHKTPQQWIDSRAASFLSIARKVLRKHKSLFPAAPAVPIIPENTNLPKFLDTYFNEKSGIGKALPAAAKNKRSYNKVIDFSQDSDDDDDDVDDPYDVELVDSLLGIVSDEAGTRLNALKISLSCSNGFLADGVITGEQAGIHRSFVSACIQKGLIDPILGEYRKLRKEAGKMMTSNEPDKDLLRMVGNILNDKMGLMIYK
jgi:hypothetical protein